MEPVVFQPDSSEPVALVCHECGYDLWAQPPDGHCPECGWPVSHSLGRTLFELSQRDLRWLAAGLTAYIIEAPVVAVWLAVWFWPPSWLDETIWSSIGLLLFAMIVLIQAIAFGTSRLTGASGGADDVALIRRSSLRTTYAVLAGIGAVFLLLLTLPLPKPVDAAVALIAGLAVVRNLLVALIADTLPGCPKVVAGEPALAAKAMPRALIEGGVALAYFVPVILLSQSGVGTGAYGCCVSYVCVIPLLVFFWVPLSLAVAFDSGELLRRVAAAIPRNDGQAA